MNYAILFHPGHNRVYFEASFKLSEGEFAIAAQHLSAGCKRAERRDICGIAYLTFETERPLSWQDLQIISDLSFVYALFQLETREGKEYLLPMERVCESFVDESMSSMLKYTGKTNEIFTRMLINLAYYSQDSREGIRLLDPIAGKGTTLYEGLRKGFDVYGIEIGDKVVNEAYHFVKRYLETARYKFSTETRKLSGPKKSFSALRHTFQAARSKEDQKANRIKTIELVAGNSLYANQYYKKNFFDLIVGDLPYGVQHGNVTQEKQSSLTRNPSELLSACLPVWREVLKPGGALALAWNSHLLSHEGMEQLLEKNGFSVKKEDCYRQFEHRVDQSILRDVVVAVKEK